MCVRRVDDLAASEENCLYLRVTSPLIWLRLIGMDDLGMACPAVGLRLGYVWAVLASLALATRASFVLCDGTLDGSKKRISLVLLL